MKTHTLSLKALKYSAFASEETHCFEAKLCIDGKPAFVVSNDGHGGSDSIDPLKFSRGSRDTTFAQVNHINEALAKASDPSEGYPDNLESVVCAMVNAHLLLKSEKAAMRTKLITVKDDEILTRKLKLKYTPELRDKLKAAYPGEIVLNGQDDQTILNAYVTSLKLNPAAYCLTKDVELAPDILAGRTQSSASVPIDLV